MIRLNAKQVAKLRTILRNVERGEGVLIEQAEADHDKVGPVTITTDSRRQSWKLGVRPR